MSYIMYIAILVVLVIVSFCASCSTGTHHVEHFDSHIPKVIWTYWNTTTIPPTIQKCLQTWKRHNPHWEIRVITDENAAMYMPEAGVLNYKFIESSQRKSDVIRCCVLAEHGGVWADASIIMTGSLDYFASIQSRGGQEFLGYYLEGFTSDPRYPVIESWFFACVPRSRFVMNWRDALLSISKYGSINDWLDYMRQKVDFQKILWPDYLAIHIAAQYVLQTQMSPNEIAKTMYLEKAEDGPLKYLTLNNWESEKALESLKHADHDGVLIKMRGGERAIVDNNPQKFEFLFEKN